MAAEPFELTPTAPSENSALVTIYDTITGVPSKALSYLVNGTLRQRRKDGSPVFSLTQPANLPPRGTLKCRLHPDSPHREEYDGMGLARCNKANIPNLFQLDRHMASRHKVEFATIKQIETDARDAEHRDYERRVQEGLLGAMNRNMFHETCVHCGESFSNTVKVAAMNQRDAHIRAQHADKLKEG